MRRALLVGLALLLLPLAAVASEEETDETVQWILGRVDLSAWDRWFIALDPACDFVPSDFLRAAAGTGQPDWEAAWADALPGALGAAVQSVVGELVVLVGFGVASAVLSALWTGMDDAGPQTVLRLLGGGLILGFCVPALQSAASVLNAVRSASESLLPLLLGLLTAFDLSAGGAELESGLALIANGMIRLSTGVLFPLALAGCVLSMPDGETERLAPLGDFCHRSARWVLGIASGFYLIVTAMRGAIAAKADSLLLRSARFAAGSLPEIGRLTADAFDVFLQCFRSVRAAFGVTAVLALLLVLLRPMLRLVLSVLTMRLAGAIVSPLGQRAYGRLLEAAASTLGIALSALGVTLTMVFVLVSIVMGVFAW